MNRITINEFEDRIRKRFPEENFSILLYSTLGKEAILRCSQCGKEIVVSKASNFLAKNKAYGCVNCHGLYKKREEKLSQLIENYNIIKETVINTHKVYTVRCKECGHSRTTTLGNLVKSPKCGCKTGVFRRTAEEFLYEFEEKTNKEYKMIEEFSGMLNKILIKHIKCGFSFRIRPSDVLYNGLCKCPKCYKNESSSCHYITSILDECGVSFEKEKRMGKTRQFFDFFLEDYNMAIEYNGEQHYSFNTKFHFTEKDFEKQKERDEKKTEYCENNGIKLVVIPYYKKRLEIKEIILGLFSESPTTKVGEVPENSVLPKKEDDIVYSPMKVGAEREGD